MKKLLKWSASILAALLILATGIGFVLPSQVSVARSVDIAAPSAAVYPLLADFKHGWTRWNTFDDEDPGIQYSYAGPDSGLGAVQMWRSKKMGDGQMTLIQADSTRLRFELSMGPAPFVLLGTMTLRPEGGATRLTWQDDMDLGKNPVKRWMGPLLKTMIGSSFEKSLANIKQLAETAGKNAAAP